MAKRHEEGKQIGGILLRNGHWYARIKIRGRQIWRSAPTREAAQLLLGRLREDAARERVGLPKVQRDTLADFAPRYLAWAKLRKRSWERDERSLRPLLATLGHFRLCELTRPRVEAYMAERRKTETLRSVRARGAFERARKAGKVGLSDKPPAPRMLSGPTVNREVACLRKILSYAVECRELPDNPVRGIRMFPEAPGRVPTLGPEDEARLQAALPAWMRPIVRLAVLTGLRQGEIVALRWRHVDFEGGTLTIEDSKSRESRRVPLHPLLTEELRARRGTPDGWVCPMPGDRGWVDRKTKKVSPPKRDPHAVSQAFRRAACKIGRGDLRFHDLRHVAGSRLLAAGANLPEVAAILGHKTLVMARRYAHVSPARLRDLVARMPALAEPGANDGEVAP